MARNASKAQVSARFARAGIMQPKVKLNSDELQARLSQRSVRFDHKSTGRLKTRSAQQQFALAD